jgi:hypothetical protein
LKAQNKQIKQQVSIQDFEGVCIKANVMEILKFKSKLLYDINCALRHTDMKTSKVTGKKYLFSNVLSVTSSSRRVTINITGSLELISFAVHNFI